MEYSDFSTKRLYLAMKSSQLRDKLKSGLEQWNTCGKRASGDNRILDMRVYLDKELILNHCVNCEHFISLQRLIIIKLTKINRERE